MDVVHKITRILLKTTLFLVLLFVALTALLYAALQTEKFQTWAAHLATNYLSNELGTKVKVGKLKINFVKDVLLQDVFIADKHNDTLLCGKLITVNVSGFDFKLHKLNLDEAELKHVTIKLLKYKNEPDFNYQFIANYFTSNDTTKTDTTKLPWKITYGKLILHNVNFRYRLLKDTFAIGQNMNYRNIYASRVNGTVSDFGFNKDTVWAQVTNFNAYEQCGFVLNNLNSKIKISPTLLQCDSLSIKTPNSYVHGNFAFNFDSWNDYDDFINKVYVKATLKDSTFLSMKDVTYFAEDINGFEENFKISGKLRGYVNDISGTNLHINYLQNTQFNGDINLTGLPYINKTYIHLDAKKLTTTKTELEHFPIPPFNKPTHIKLPKEVASLGIVNYKGKFDGFIDNFVAYGTFKTAIGNVKTDIAVNNSNPKKPVEYHGTLITTNFNIAKLIPSASILGPLSLTTKISGKGVALKNLNTTLDGEIQSITFNNYKYDKLKVDGTLKDKIFKGNLASRDTNANFDFYGTVDLNYKVPKMDFISTINNFDLDKTHFSTSKLNGKVSSQILINLNGDDVDNLTGLVNFDNTIYKANNKEYKISSFNLELDQENVIKKVKLTSNILNAQLQGKYKLSTLTNAFKQYLNNYFPTFIKTTSRYYYSDKADIAIKVKNFTIIKELFVNDLMISPNTIIEGAFDASINYLYLKSNSDLIEYAGIKFKENKFDVNSLVNGVTLNYKAKSINLSDSFAFKNPTFNVVSNDKLSRFNLDWNNKKTPENSGNLNGNVLFGSSQATLMFNKITCTIVDTVWQMIKPNPITIDTAFLVNIEPITFYNQNQLITFDGKLSKNNNDKFDVFIQNFKLNQFNNLLAQNNLSINGEVTGNTSIYGALGKKIINSHLNFNQLYFNKKFIGNAEVNSDYNPEKDVVAINGHTAFSKDLDGNLLKNIEFDGFYYPKKETENLDLSFTVHPLDLSILQPFLQDIITFKIGYINGGGKITGTPDKPQINGKFKIFRCIAVVDFLNTQYNITGNIDVLPTQINFEGLELRDKMGNTGTIDGRIFHQNFKNMRIDFDINTNKLMVLNTTQANNPSYYGTAFASGNAGIYGFVDDMKMEINMKTNGGTYFNIPLDGPSEISNNDFIKFVNVDTIKKIVKQSTSNFSLDFNLEATPDAEVKLIFDEKSGDVINARGAGNLNMKINSKGKFDMFGDYILSTGDYLFTLENFVTKKFEIEKGSSIKWNGNVYKANIDIVANYKQRASIKPLFPNDTTSNYSKRFPVDCKLFMKNKLTQPDITFGIELPTIDEVSRTAIKSILVDENEMNRQVFSLLLLRSFVTPLSSATSAGGITAGQTFATTGSEMLSNKISSWLNGVTKEVDIGVNYRPGTSLSSDELDLTLNKQLFNNRLVIDGNIGVSNNTSNKTTSNSNGFIGDVTVEYKLNEAGKCRIKGFNRSNDNTQVINSGGPFTQGIGIFYREEFETISDLYHSYLNKIKRKKAAAVN